MNIKDYIIDRLADVVRAGGDLVSPAQRDTRINNACAGCEYLGNVEPLPLLITTGCTICGCPIKSKASTLTVLTVKGYKREECEHPDGSKWSEIDKLFESEKP